MGHTQLPPRIASLLAAVEREAERLTTGKLAVINAVRRARLVFKRCAPATVPAGPTDLQLERRDGQTRAVAAALLEGRHLSYKDSDEFGIVEWHTRIAEVRTRFRERGDVRLADTWAQDQGGTRYKVYWAESVPQEPTLFSQTN